MSQKGVKYVANEKVKSVHILNIFYKKLIVLYNGAVKA